MNIPEESVNNKEIAAPHFHTTESHGKKII